VTALNITRRIAVLAQPCYSATHYSNPVRRFISEKTMASRRLQTYSTEQVTVTFDPTRCIHAAECIRAQPEVFDSRRRRWIRPELGAPDAIADAVRRCPTGALHYQLPEGAVETPADGATLHMKRNGPLYVRGKARVEREDGSAILEDYRFALCRCGATANVPFCDGSHTRVGFSDTMSARTDSPPAEPPLSPPPIAP
jgi:uncharacterized Fe-S cluster protein YjdI/CDGSH-type Zn-finger protein